MIRFSAAMRTRSVWAAGIGLALALPSLSNAHPLDYMSARGGGVALALVGVGGTGISATSRIGVGGTGIGAMDVIGVGGTGIRASSKLVGVGGTGVGAMIGVGGTGIRATFRSLGVGGTGLRSAARRR